MSTFMEPIQQRITRLARAGWLVPVLVGALALVLLTARLLLPASPQAVGNIQEALKNHKIADPGDFVSIYLPKALLIDAGLCAVLLLMWWWGRREISTRNDDRMPGVKPGERRVLWMVVALSMLASGVLNGPRLQLSLWNDEVTALRYFMVGGVRRVKKDNTLHVEPATWTQTAFGYWRPNNHVLYSMAARLSQQAWPRSKDKTAPYFSEAALRLPAFLAGLAALATLGGLSICLGLPRVGMVAVVLFALHPWHVRFTTEARGYAFLLMLAPALLTSLVKGSRTGRWRWWLCAGILQFLLVYSIPLSIYIIVPAVCGAGLFVLRCWITGRDRITVLMRLGCGGLLGAMLAMPLMLPLFPQVGPFLESRVTVGQIDLGWVQRGLAELFSGVAWNKIDPANPYTRPWMQLAASNPWLVWSGVVGMALALIAGIVFLWRHGQVTRCLLPALLAPSLLVTLVGIAKKFLVYHQYLVIGLPGLIMVMAAGVVALAQICVPRKVRTDWPALLLCAVACILFGAATHHQRRIMRAIPLEPRRDAALVYHKTLNPRDRAIDDVVSAAFTPDRAYDPGSYRVTDAGDIQNFIEMAGHMKRPLYLSYQLNDPDAASIVEKSGQFEHVKTFYGTVEESAISVFRHRSGGK